MKPLEILRIKDIMRIMNCSEYIARKIRMEVAEHFSMDKKRVTYQHLKDYFGLKD